MSKTKEREAEKSSSKSSSRTSSKVVVGKAASSKLSAASTKTQTPASKAASAKMAAAATKSSGKLPATKASAVLKAHNDKAEKSEKNEKSEKSEKSERLLKAEKVEKAEKAEKAEKPEKVEKLDKSDRVVKAERQEKVERSERASERLERAERAERAAAPPLPTKSPFPKDELGKWRVQLLSRRYEISSDIAGLEKDAMEAEDGHTTPNHLAERGSDADLQDVSLGIAGEEKDIIWQIDRALRKIDESQPIPFGLCEYTKEAIPRSRLQLIPWTPLSIEGATHMEQKGLQVEDMLVDG